MHMICDSKSIEIFKDHVTKECKRYGVIFKLHHESYIDCDGSILGGYFQESPLELVVADNLDNNVFLSSLVHEYSHFEQWRDDSPIYSCKWRNTFADQILDRWLNGETFAESTLDKCISIVRNMELDCERRSMANIIKHKLPILLSEYAQNASAYIYFYHYIRLVRRWNGRDGKSVYEIPQIISEMPNTLDGDYNTIPEAILKLFKKYL